MFRSIRYKIITIYFLLVFIAISIVGFFIINEFEKLHINMSSDTLNNIINNLVKPQVSEKDFVNYKNIQNKIGNIPLLASEYEILIIDTKNDFRIIASTNSNSNFINKNALIVLDKDIMLRSSQSGVVAERDIKSIKVNGHKIKNIAVPYKNTKGDIIGIIYGRAYLENIYKVLDNSKVIFLKAMIIALIVTILLGFLIAKSITNPINDVTVKALKMAKGDFDQKVDIKSDDEIGKLGEMFNYLTAKLKCTLDEISSEKSKLDAIINQMADGLIAVDNEGFIMHVNPTFIKMLNLKEEDIKQLTYDEILGKYNENLTLKNIKNKNKSQGNEVIKLENGDILKANFVYLKNENNQVKGLVLVLQDITEHEKLDNMRKEFVANVSHELKTPITTVKSYTETLLDGAMEDKEICKSFLNVINRESERMARLVSDLLQLSRLDYKKTSFNFSKFNLDKLIKDVVNKLEISFKEKNHTLNLGLNDENIIINGDKYKIEQVLQNILTNAIKYTPENGIISIDVKKQKEYVIISISDNGIGIPKEAIPRIFERFYRVDKARSRDMGGTGLGLSIAKHIIEEHKGDISVESELGKGTTFKIKLPVNLIVL
ncbi:two-component system histidine kinase PnpS [Tepidibacter thalassicus]|uniref:histidine kinase n=1 Tax=Tepidibacter thalassicus DSM 15285 TaxID=1123350 RepID=A0A1M5TNF7_9FIRM|nr:ATP-binding protein [Tepidibacter thalassicus]SHH52244.1 two-component system, OmpR family, sensor histidine kinase VicK [Tepidibacter thalassicus DSM 15285]